MAEIYGKGMVAWCEVVMLYHGGGRDDYNGVGVPPPDLGGGGLIVFMDGSYIKR